MTEPVTSEPTDDGPGPAAATDRPPARAAGRVAAGAAVLVVVAFGALGVQNGGFGVAWPAMRADLDRPLAAIGVVLGFGTAGFLTAALTNRRVLPVLGVGRQLPVAALLVAGGLGLMAWSPTWPVLLAGSAVSGLGAGSVEAVLNTHLSVLGHTRLLNLVHGAFGVGATLGPLLVTPLIEGGAGWQVGFAALALVWAIVAVGLVGARDGWGVARQPVVRGGPAPPRGRPVVVVVIAASFVAYTAAELSVGYLSLPLLEGRGASPETASRWIAAYWGALTVGRLLLGSVGVRVAPGRLVAAAASLAVVGALGLWLAPQPAASLGLVVIGFGFAGIFPALVALVPLRVGEAAAPGAVGVGMAAASVGVALGPAVVGSVAERAGTAAVAPALVVATGLVLVVHGVATLVVRRHRPGAVPASSRDWPSVVAPEP